MNADSTTLYVELLKRALTRFDFGDNRHPLAARAGNDLFARMMRFVNAQLRRFELELDRVRPFERELRTEGRDWPYEAETMIGIKRLDNLEQCITEVLADNVPGDLLEAGVWRGGSVIFMRALLEVLGDEERIVWAADSFRGLPSPDPSIPEDHHDKHHEHAFLAVTLDQVKYNLDKYGFLDGRVCFLEGWFSDTLPAAPIKSLAILRADGDMYGSTMDILVSLYSKVSDGGFVIIDDFHAVPGCSRAVLDFRARHSVQEPMIPIDWSGVYWRKGSESSRGSPV